MLNTNSNPVGILYIDDEEKALKYFRMAFGQKYQVFTATSGPEGLDILRREADAIGIVISDQRMPGMQGAEVLGQVRAKFPHIVRLLTTAYSDLDSAIQAVNRGHIYQYVVKPWEVPELGMILQRAADYYQVISERNNLLRLKMTTLQRIICSDRLKSLLLAVRDWPEERQAPVRRALGGLIAALPSRGDVFVPETTAFRPQDFEPGNLVLSGYRNTARLLDALEGNAPTPEDLAARLAGWGTAQARNEGGRWILAFGDGCSPKALTRGVFGALVEQEVSSEIAAVFQALVHLASAGGSLRMLGGEAVVAEIDPPASPLSAEDLIEALFQKYSDWDIASR
jgi:Response regulator containing CheY-like receiver, AAA-type ATPase, and DNA-binding domains